VTLQLQAGDIMLYRPVGLFGQVISIKTWHEIAHVEIYDGPYLHNPMLPAGQDQYLFGAPMSLASRDKIGVGRYLTRMSKLRYVLRTKRTLDLFAAREWFKTVDGQPYGWEDLLYFAGLTVFTQTGMVCSPFAAKYLQMAGWKIFPTDPVEKIAPFQFLDLVGDECSIVYDIPI